MLHKANELIQSNKIRLLEELPTELRKSIYLDQGCPSRSLYDYKWQDKRKTPQDALVFLQILRKISSLKALLNTGTGCPRK